MSLSHSDIERLIDWGREVFIHRDIDWSIADDDLYERLLASFYQYQRANSTN